MSETMVTLGDPGCLNYLRQISLNKNEYFFLPWGGVAIRDCSENGELRTFVSLSDFKTRKIRGEFQWLHLTLNLFVDQGETYPIFRCPKCPSMASVETMSCQQNKDGMEALRCMHSILSLHLASDWRNIWDIPNLDNQVDSFQLLCTPEIRIKKLRHDHLFLCATQSNGIVSLLFTVIKRQKTPFCSQCPSSKCKCYRIYMKEKNDHESGTRDGEDYDWPDDWPLSEEDVESVRVHHYEVHSFIYKQCVAQYKFSG